MGAPTTFSSLVTSEVAKAMNQSHRVGDLSMKERICGEDDELVMLASSCGGVSLCSLLSNDALMEEAERFLGISPFPIFPLGGLGASSSSLGASVVLLDWRRFMEPRVPEEGVFVWMLT